MNQKVQKNQAQVICISNTLKYIEGCSIRVDTHIIYNESYFMREDGSFIILGYGEASKALVLDGDNSA